MATEQLHDNCMSVVVIRLGNRETSVVQSFHVGKLLHGWQPRQVQPRHVVPVLVVVALVLQLTKGRPSQSEIFHCIVSISVHETKSATWSAATHHSRYIRIWMHGFYIAFTQITTDRRTGTTVINMMSMRTFGIKFTNMLKNSKSKLKQLTTYIHNKFLIANIII